MSIKQKILNSISLNPKLAAFGIGLAITMAVGTAIGMLDHGHIAYAVSQSNTSTQTNTNTG
jgi:predicted DNA-binding protein with PD1-like motif